MPAFKDITGLRYGRLTVLRFLQIAKSWTIAMALPMRLRNDDHCSDRPFEQRPHGQLRMRKNDLQPQSQGSSTDMPAREPIREFT